MTGPGCLGKVVESHEPDQRFLACIRRLVCAADAAETGIASLRVVDCSDTSPDHPGLGYSDDMNAPLALS
jgi:hypothetical protein